MVICFIDKQKKLAYQIGLLNELLMVFNIYKYYTKSITIINNFKQNHLYYRLIKTFISLQERANGGIFYAKI